MKTLLNQTCYISRRAGDYTILGEETHGDPVEYKCRIDFNTKLIFNAEGVQVPSIATVYIDTDITEHDWVYIDAHTEEFAISAVNRYNYCKFNTAGIDGTQFMYGIGKQPLQVNHLFNGVGSFHHCEVFI